MADGFDQITAERKAWAYAKVTEAWEAGRRAVEDPDVNTAERDKLGLQLLDAIAIAEEWGVARLAIFEQMGKAL